jgi:hypothetical protein
VEYVEEVAYEQWDGRESKAVDSQTTHGLDLDILMGTTMVAEATRAHALTMSEIEQWKEHFLMGAEDALRSRTLDEEAQKDREIKRLKQKDRLLYQH